MVIRQQIDGIGAVFVDDTGRVRIVVSDECSEMFDAAQAKGITADELVNALLAQAEASRVEADRIADERRKACVGHADANSARYPTDGSGSSDESNEPTRRAGRCEQPERSRRREQWRNRAN